VGVVLLPLLRPTVVGNPQYYELAGFKNVLDLTLDNVPQD